MTAHGTVSPVVVRVVTTVVVAVLAVLVPPASAGAQEVPSSTAVPSLTATPSTGLLDGHRVTVTGRGLTPNRTYVVVDGRNGFAEEIAAFCGATGIVQRPLSGEALRELLELEQERTRELPTDLRGDDSKQFLPERLLKDLVGEGAHRLIDALTDPETGLYNYDYLSFKLDEEFKRARRFDQPLSCVMLGFEGQVEDAVLGQLSSIFLNASRDTDILGRFDQSSFLFFLPNTGPDGAAVMARRIRESAEREGLRDLVGDRLSIAVGISFCPHPAVRRREDLFSRARAAFLSAQREGGVIVHSE